MISAPYERKEVAIQGGFDNNPAISQAIKELTADGWKYMGASGVPPYKTTKLMFSRGVPESGDPCD